MNNTTISFDPELDKMLSRGETKSRRRTLVVMLVYLGTAIAVLSYTARSVRKAQQDVAQAETLLTTTKQESETALSQRDKANEVAESVRVEIARSRETWSEDMKKLEERRLVLNQEVTRLKEDRSRLLNAIDDGRAKETAEKIMHETGSDRKQARQLWKEGYKAFNDERLRAAAALYQQSLDADETYAPPYNSLGRISAKHDDPVTAERYYRQALRHRDYYAPALHNMGVLRFETNEYEESRQWVDRALMADPSYAPSKKIDKKLRALGH